MTEALPKPDRPAKGQRWRYDGRDKARTFEVAEVLGKRPDEIVRLKAIEGTATHRTVEWSRLWLHEKYTYLGDFSVPEGYKVLAVGPRYHCFRDPHGYAEGQPGWSWQDARAAAVRHAEAAKTSRKRKG